MVDQCEGKGWDHMQKKGEVIGLCMFTDSLLNALAAEFSGCH